MYFKNFGWKRIVVYCLSYFVFSTVLSLIISSNTAAKDASGSTLGVNLIMGANDHMNGTVNDEVFKKGILDILKKYQCLSKRFYLAITCNKVDSSASC